MDTMLMIGAGVAAFLVLTQTAMVAIIWRQRQTLARVDDRLTHLAGAITLLADTTEGGFRDVAREIERLGSADAMPARTRAAVQSRVAGAASRGRSVQDIAAMEQISEGEVRLHLQLSTPRAAKVADAPVR